MLKKWNQKQFKSVKEFVKHSKDPLIAPDLYFTELVFLVFQTAIYHRALSVEEFLSSGKEALNLVHHKSRMVTDIITNGLKQLEPALKTPAERTMSNDTPAFSNEIDRKLMSD